MAVGTLLGPERTGDVGTFGCLVACFFLGPSLVSASAGVLPRVGLLVSGVGGACGWGFRLLFENCTVDASIFVAKFLRAHGGCLGTRSR